MMSTHARILIFILWALPGAAQKSAAQKSVAQTSDTILQFVFTSDVHYGITRAHFRGADSVPSTVVSRAMIAAIKDLPAHHLPQDGGVAEGQRIGHLDAILITGDIANREETGIQPASASWKQFEKDYDLPTPILLGPGNHDVSNAIGFWRPVNPAKDAGSMAGIYNRMMNPGSPKTAATYNYTTDKIHFIKNIGGIDLLFVNCWPDSTEQAWMTAHLTPNTPVLLFTHSQPDVEARFFTNPNGNHGIDSTHKFENLLPEPLQDGLALKDSTLIEQRGFAAFLKQHPMIKAYFHGHNNYTEYYEYRGPEKNIELPCFRVDSPMKGKFSSKDETLLSFELITIDTRKKTMTVRECRWNPEPKDPSVIRWEKTKTIAL